MKFLQTKSRSTERQNRRDKRRGMTLVELLIVIIVVGVLAALATPTVVRIFDASGDTTKYANSKKMTEYMSAAYNAGVDTSYADGTAAINALKAGIAIPATVPGGATQELKLEQDVNPAAYIFTPGTSTTPPSFSPKLGERNVRP
jgi:prepilin-type N-terminal cleavage/methylation domain-containing protein